MSVLQLLLLLLVMEVKVHQPPDRVRRTFRYANAAVELMLLLKRKLHHRAPRAYRQVAMMLRRR